MTVFYIGIVVAVAMSYRFHFLTRSGAVAAFFVGGIIYGAFNINGLVLLAFFFLSSSLLTKWKQGQKKQMVSHQETARTASQVMANGGVAALAALGMMLWPSFHWVAMFTATLAAATADTWASELGALSKGRPVDLLTGKRVVKGTSGAISLQGTVAALFGSFFISFISGLCFSFNAFWIMIFTLFGFIGNVIDTILGGTGQAVYRCRQCGIEIEEKTHCHKRATLIKGRAWLDNDMVNGLAMLSAGVMAFVFIMIYK